MTLSIEQLMTVLQREAREYWEARYVRHTGLCVDVCWNRSGLGGDVFLYSINGQPAGEQAARTAIAASRGA